MKRRNRKHYRFGETFMERGGIYGRAFQYPWRGLRIKRVFRSVIRVSLKPLCDKGPNVHAFNTHEMHVMLAYEFRSRRYRNGPPPPSKEPAPIPEDQESVWMEAA